MQVGRTLSDLAVFLLAMHKKYPDLFCLVQISGPQWALKKEPEDKFLVKFLS